MKPKSNWEKEIREVARGVKAIGAKSQGKKIALYTSVFQSFEPIDLPILPSNDLWDSFVISDGSAGDVQPKVNVIQTSYKSKNPRMSAKFFKINPHLFFDDYEFSLYVDANCILKDEIEELLGLFVKENRECVFFRHNRRNCAYKECAYIAKIGKESLFKLAKIFLFMKRDRFPKEFGLIQGGFIFRKHNTSQVRRLMECWWHYINEYSERDQLFLNYVAWKLGYDIDYLEELILHDSPFTQIIPHAAVRFNKRGLPNKGILSFILNVYLNMRSKK